MRFPYPGTKLVSISKYLPGLNSSNFTELQQQQQINLHLFMSPHTCLQMLYVDFQLQFPLHCFLILVRFISTSLIFFGVVFFFAVWAHSSIVVCGAWRRSLRCERHPCHRQPTIIQRRKCIVACVISTYDTFCIINFQAPRWLSSAITVYDSGLRLPHAI